MTIWAFIPVQEHGGCLKANGTSKYLLFWMAVFGMD
jgi:hypothetical protein